MKTMLMVSMLLCFLCPAVSASVDFYSIEIGSFVEKGNDEFVLNFKPLSNMGSLSRNEQVSLHIQFNVKCVTRLKQSENLIMEKRKYLEAVVELRNQISKSKRITFGIKSGKGFHKIPGKTTEYQCKNLSLLKMGNEQIVYAVHADIGDAYCE